MKHSKDRLVRRIHTRRSHPHGQQLTFGPYQLELMYSSFTDAKIDFATGVALFREQARELIDDDTLWAEVVEALDAHKKYKDLASSVSKSMSAYTRTKGKPKK